MSRAQLHKSADIYVYISLYINNVKWACTSQSWAVDQSYEEGSSTFNVWRTFGAGNQRWQRMTGSDAATVKLFLWIVNKVAAPRRSRVFSWCCLHECRENFACVSFFHSLIGSGRSWPFLVREEPGSDLLQGPTDTCCPLQLWFHWGPYVSCPSLWPTGPRSFCELNR